MDWSLWVVKQRDELEKGLVDDGVLLWARHSMVGGGSVLFQEVLETILTCLQLDILIAQLYEGL